MSLFTAKDFAALFKEIVPTYSGEDHKNETLGLAWFGDEGTLPSVEDAQQFASATLFPERQMEHKPEGYYSSVYYNYWTEKAEPWDVLFDTSEPEELTVAAVRSTGGKMVLAVSDNSEENDDVLQTAYFLETALKNFPIKFSEITGKGKQFHPFLFTVMQDANVTRLRHKISHAVSATGDPSEAWALCLHAAEDLANIAIFSFVEAGEIPHGPAQLIFSGEALQWQGNPTSPTVCMFWWKEGSEIVARTRKAAKTVRVRVRLSPRGY